MFHNTSLWEVFQLFNVIKCYIIAKYLTSIFLYIHLWSSITLTISLRMNYKLG